MDTDLVVRAQGGDREAFADLAATIADRFLATSHRILSDIDLAEDATQQALISVWHDLPQLRDPARFEAWSYRLLVRACYAEGRKSRRWAPNIRLLTVDEPMAADGMGSVVDRDQLERAFRRLSLDHRTAVVLHHYLDLPLDQVAELVGYAGLLVELTGTASCVPDSAMWTTTDPEFSLPVPDPGDRTRVWILDVEGNRLVIFATEDANFTDPESMQTLVDTIQIVVP